jgi:FkbM family methyltransferase
MNVKIREAFRDFKLKNIFDIGFGISDNNFYEYENSDINYQFFEPNILYFNQLIIKFGKYKNIKLHNCAIFDENKIVDFYLDGAYSFVGGVYCQAQRQLKNNAEVLLNKTRIKILGNKISEFDSGNIDFLSLDCEGCEWFALKHLISRPKIIRLVNFCEGGYCNIFNKEIQFWIFKENYRIAFSDNPADCVYNYYYIKE